MRVKVCGLRNYADADLALNLGATEVGFIFTNSPRQMDLEDAKLICRNLPKESQVIGVFKNDLLDHILTVVEEVNLKGVQLHGQETNAFMKLLKTAHPNLKIFKTIGVDQGEFLSDPQDYESADVLLFDASASHFESSTRRPIDSKKLEILKTKQSIYLAGGITPSNVTDLITRYRPQGIDVSSGIEISPGLKDAKLMQKLFSRLKDLP